MRFSTHSRAGHARREKTVHIGPRAVGWRALEFFPSIFGICGDASAETRSRGRVSRVFERARSLARTREERER